MDGEMKSMDSSQHEHLRSKSQEGEVRNERLDKLNSRHLAYMNRLVAQVCLYSLIINTLQTWHLSQNNLNLYFLITDWILWLLLFGCCLTIQMKQSPLWCIKACLFIALALLSELSIDEFDIAHFQGDDDSLEFEREGFSYSIRRLIHFCNLLLMLQLSAHLSYLFQGWRVTVHSICLV